MQELESILQEGDENGLSLDGSLLFYSGAMAPLNFKPASTSSNKLGSGSLLDYISELLKPYSVSSSSIKPIILDRDEIDLACKAAKEWSKEFAVPSLPIAPKVEMDYGAKAWEDAIYKLNLSAPSSPLRPGNKPGLHGWSPQNNVLSGFYSPSSPISPFKAKANPWKEEKLSFGMPKLPSFEPPKFEIPKLPSFEPPKTDFSWLKPTEPIMPDFNMYNSGWGAKQNIKINASSWEQPAFEMPKLPSFEPPKFKMPEADLSPLFKLSEREKPFGLIDPQPFQYGFDLGGKLKLDFHGPDPTTLAYGHVKPQLGNNIIKEYNGYECSILDPILKNNFKKFP